MVAILAPQTLSDEYLWATLEEPDFKYSDHIRVFANALLRHADPWVDPSSANLSTKRMRTWIGRKEWDTVRDICEWHRIITNDHYYIKGEKTISYRISASHATKLIPHEIGNKPLARRVLAKWEMTGQDMS